MHCVHLPAGLGRTSAQFEIGIHACGTQGNTENGLYGYGAESGSGTWFENIIVIQYDPQVQEMWDKARKLRCTWHDLYEKSVTFRPFPVDTLDVIRTDFAGDNVGCWMQIQVGKGIENWKNSPCFQNFSSLNLVRSGTKMAALSCYFTKMNNVIFQPLSKMQF